MQKYLKAIGNERGSFVVDIFLLLPFIAALSVLLSIKLSLRYLKHAVFVLFICVAAGLYVDLIRPPLFFSVLSGNDFMWNWPLYPLTGHRMVPFGHIPTYTSWSYNILALGLFLFYVIIFWAGVQFGYILFGRSRKQKGMIDLLFARSKGSKNQFN